MKYLWMVPLLSTAFAFDPELQTIKELEALRADPQRYYETPPTKMISSSSAADEDIIPLVLARQEARAERFELPDLFKSKPGPKDQVRDLVYNNYSIESNFTKINNRGLHKGEVATMPWGGHYWPVYRGVIGQRYADNGFVDSSNTWFRGYQYIKQNSADAIYESGDTESINKLSPAEKYDLVMGTDFALTDKMWGMGKMFFERDGKVETWMGICHGWAPASYTSNRPLKAITVPSAKKGIPITFYPADLKALAAALHAYTKVNVNLAGVRCDETVPQTDHDGRVLNQDCLDTNPATFHLGLVNQLGIVKKPLISDTSYDFEVWNAPMTSYRFVYFNPATKQVPRMMKDAVVPVNSFRDSFSQHRAPETRYIVGVTATVTYATETWATAREEHNPNEDRYNKIIYTYDLELDANYNIVGGEWHKRLHPDFLWTPRQNTDVVTEGDIRLVDKPAWGAKTKVTSEYSKEAKIVAEKHGAPLALVVERFIQLSRSNE